MLSAVNNDNCVQKDQMYWNTQRKHAAMFPLWKIYSVILAFVLRKYKFPTWINNFFFFFFNSVHCCVCFPSKESPGTQKWCFSPHFWQQSWHFLWNKYEKPVANTNSKESNIQEGTSKAGCALSLISVEQCLLSPATMPDCNKYWKWTWIYSWA